MYRRITLRVTYKEMGNSIYVEEVELQHITDMFTFLCRFKKQVNVICYNIIIRGYRKISKKYFDFLLSDKLCNKITYSDYFDLKKDFHLKGMSLKYYRNIYYLVQR